MLGFTAHHVIAADVDPDWLMTQLAGGTPSMPLTARFLTLLGERIGAVPGGQDILLVTDGTGRGHPGSEPANPAALDHPRVTRALRSRDDVRAVTVDGGGVLLIGRGLAGRWEVSVEVDEAARGRGIARGLLSRARDLVPAGELIWAQVHPANVASVRAFLAAGYRPVGAEALFTRPAAAPVQ